MDEIKGFTFYKNYYDIIKYLDDKDKLTLLNAIFEYIFEDKEPILEGLNLGIWNNIQMPLNTTKINIVNGQKGGAPKGNKNAAKKQPKNNPKTTQKQPNIQPKNKQIYISNFLFLFSNINILSINNKEYINNLFKEYLELRINKKYTLTETIVKRLINKLNEYGITDEEKIEIITNAINGAWKDFYPLKEHKIMETKPDWYGKEFEENKATNEEIEELEAKIGRVLNK